MKLFVDDLRNPNQPPRWKFWSKRWAVARTFDDAIRLLTLHNIQELSLDHDLGEEKTGYDIAKWLEKRAYYGFTVPKAVTIHSANPVGRKNIELALTSMRRLERVMREGLNKIDF